LGEKLDNPSTFPYTVGRMALEILAFRSLFRNLRSELIETPQRPEGAKLVYWSYKWLWLGAIAFHYAFLTVVLRHLRFFTDPVPQVINKLAEVDGFVQFFVPTVYLSGVVLVVALLYLLGRRLTNPYLRYISLASDYFPLFLILGIGTTGILMRYVYRVDITKVKELALGGLLSFQQTAARPGGVSEPHPESHQQQPDGHAYQPLELSGEIPHLYGSGK